MRKNRHRSFTFSPLKRSVFSNLFSRKLCHLAALVVLLPVMNGNRHSMTPALKSLRVLIVFVTGLAKLGVMEVLNATG